VQKKEKMNRSYRKSNRKKAVRIGAIFSFIILLMFAGYAYYNLNLSKKTVLFLEEKLMTLERTVFVAMEKMPKGTVLTIDKLDRQIRYTDYPQDVFITEEDLGKALALDVMEGTCLMDIMVCCPEENVREFFLEDVEIPEHIQKGDRVDLRIRYGNAEEYVVLADKIILDCRVGYGMVIALTEEECLLVSSAVSDTRDFSKTKLYVVEYPEYDQKEKGQSTYLANHDVLLQLGKEKTKGESRTALEQRLLQKK
jgi:hypothetical protein